MARVWVLTSGRTGDDKQGLRLADALGVPFEEKKIVFNARARTWRLALGPSLASVEVGRSSSLAAPWPDLVISTGWRQVPVVRWVARASGGRTRLVQMNRPPGPRHFDLILSPPQYRIPPRPNVIRLDWPLQLPPDPAALAAAEQAWKTRLDPHPHPWTVLLLGGDSHPFVLDRAGVASLFEQAHERARSRGGTLMISTSRRTPKAVVEALSAAASAAGGHVMLYDWRPDAPDNPYVALLAGGDEFVVTPDSISMLVEVARLGRPLSIAPHGLSRSLTKRLRQSAKRLLHGDPERPASPLRQRMSDLASLAGLKFERDLAAVSRRMVEQGWAAPFPAFGGGRGRCLPDDDFDRLVERVRALLDSGDA